MLLDFSYRPSLYFHYLFKKIETYPLTIPKETFFLYIIYIDFCMLINKWARGSFNLINNLSKPKKNQCVIIFVIEKKIIQIKIILFLKETRFIWLWLTLELRQLFIEHHTCMFHYDSKCASQTNFIIEGSKHKTDIPFSSICNYQLI